MCNPAIFMLASAGVSAYSSVQQGRAQQQASEFNAKTATRNAEAVENEKLLVSEQAAIDRRRLAEMFRGERGEQIAAAAAMGIDPGFGTSADLIGDMTRAYSIDRSILNRNEIATLEGLDKQQADYKDSGRLSIMEGKSAMQAGYMGAAASLLDGASTVSSKWMKTPTNDNVVGGVKKTGQKPPTKGQIKLDRLRIGA